MRAVLARGIWAAHLGVVVFLCTGWALPWAWAIWAAVIFHPLVQLNWWIFDNRCVLTVLEERLRAGLPEPARAADAGAEEAEEYVFIAELGARLLGRPIPSHWADVASYTVLWGGFVVASVRLLLREST